MERTKGILIALSALVAISAIDIAAQDEIETRRAVRGTPGVEAIMGMREGGIRSAMAHHPELTRELALEMTLEAGF